MPIAREFRHFYRGPQWQAARARIRERSGGVCEFCGKPGGKWVAVMRDGTGRWNRRIVETLLKDGSPMSYLVSELAETVAAPLNPRSRTAAAIRAAWRSGWFSDGSDYSGMRAQTAACTPTLGRVYLIKPVLTTAHMNHVAGDDRDENLRGLCECCHLRYDREHHKMMRGIRKDAGRPLLVEIVRAQAEGERA